MPEMPFNWSKLQSADEMDIGRYFEYDSFAVEMFKRWLPKIEIGGNILEVGSGSGFFTRKLRVLYPTTRITCLEPDPELMNSLLSKFDNVDIIESSLEKASIPTELYDLSISHIVIHNLADPMVGLQQMKKAVKTGGYVICIEPTSGYRHIMPNSEVRKALGTLGEYTRIMSNERVKTLNFKNRKNPFSYSYPEFFEELGLKNIRCYGWCSVFTLSDSRFDFNQRKLWITRRKKLFLDEREQKTRVLVEAGMNQSRIDGAYETVLSYFETLENANEEEISHIHEQEITNRVITIGQKV